MNYAEKLKQRLKENVAQILGTEHDLRATEKATAYIFHDISMNFHEASYAHIMDKPAWQSRLKKPHSHFNDGTLEMQSSNSSDALLMNIFCHPNFWDWSGVSSLLQIKPGASLEFGWHPTFDNENRATEIDLKIGDSIFEAKLTESDFTEKDLVSVQRYASFDQIFDSSCLLTDRGTVRHYQLIRNILTAEKYEMSFTLLVDQERIDLIRSLFEASMAVLDKGLRRRIRFVSWQEIASVCGKNLSTYLEKRYF